MSSTDPLTGVMNRRSFLERGERERRRAQRYKRELSVLVFNPCYFQSGANSLSGYLDDHTLSQVADICRQAIRDSDVIGRIGDVEFGFILPETPEANAALLAERLHNKIVDFSSRTGDKYHVIS